MIQASNKNKRYPDIIHQSIDLQHEIAGIDQGLD